MYQIEHFTFRTLLKVATVEIHLVGVAKVLFMIFFICKLHLFITVIYYHIQQLSHMSQVFGVGYMNQKRITPDRAHGSALSTHSYRAICLH